MTAAASPVPYDRDRPAIFRRLLPFARPHRWRLRGTIACSIVAAALDAFSFTLLVPFLNALFGKADLLPGTGWITRVQEVLVGRFLDPADPRGSLDTVLLVIIVITVAKNVFVWLGGQLGASLQEYVTRDLRDAVFRHLDRLSLRWFQRTKAGQIIARVLGDTDQTKVLITELVTRSIQHAAQILAFIVMLVGYSPRLTLVALVIAPLLTLTLQPILRRLRRGHRRGRDEHGEMTSVVQEAVSGIRLVKAFRGEAYEDGRFLATSHRYSNVMMRTTRVALLSQPLTEVIGTTIAVLVLWIGAREVLAGSADMTGAVLIAFMTGVMKILPPLKALSQMRTTAEQAFAAAERVFEIFDQPTEAQTDRGIVQTDALRESVVFDRVSFAYDDGPVLRDISFRAAKGEVIALVGPSGAGKSTLVDLIPRFYEPTEGRILIDGVNSRDITLPSLRSLTGIVSQDTVLFNDTVHNNIAYGGGKRFTREQVEAAARAANAHDFIAALPAGYDTILGERGTRLSGGQRQRVAIARALLVDPPILILDEATSALDTESERLVQEAIDRLLAGRTVFVIAHRLSTVTHADLILVLDRGEIVERGSHAELLAAGGAYHRLHSLQFGAQPAP
jgi:subfamily B ATP-binding cassette protein MsbA